MVTLELTQVIELTAAQALHYKYVRRAIRTLTKVALPGTQVTFRMTADVKDNWSINITYSERRKLFFFSVSNENEVIYDPEFSELEEMYEQAKVIVTEPLNADKYQAVRDQYYKGKE